MKSNTFTLLLIICFVSITLSLVSFTHAEESQRSYWRLSRADNATTTTNSTSSSLTSGGKTATSGGSSGGDGSGGTNTTATAGTGALTSGALTSGALSSGGLSSGGKNSTGGNSTTASLTTGGVVVLSTSTSTGSIVVVITFTYEVTLDPATFNKTALILAFAQQLGITNINEITVTLTAISSKRSVQAAGKYDLVIVITGAGLDKYTAAELNSVANSTAIRNGILNAGVVSIDAVKPVSIVASSSTTGSTTGADSSDGSSGLSAGAIAGIVIGVVAVVTIVVAAVIISKKRSKKNTQVQPANGPHYP